ncbi:hypothetical protein F5J12DRAFT_308469 [Pisolithus orientalis]|uniref:uncharacterized protein n=1 Tax=Pisolithus orientalis TaxID=936130 RepID=UPI002225129A|nr:uncharacterized protein F5J12DRAFT_308469 [Pisolithus orientalis]KAI6030778.1 hypothetical protein F5J12DRAFT_308469 [Pisolithus orientalis]
MSAGRSPGPTWTTLRGGATVIQFPAHSRKPPLMYTEPTDASSVMRSSDDDGDDELEVEKELTDPPLQKRKAQYSPSTALRVNKFPRLGLSGSSNTGRWVQGIASDDSEDAGGSTGPRPSVNVSCTLSTCAIDKSTSTKSTFTGGSSSDEFGGTLSQVIRQANTKERLDERKKNMDVEVQRDPRRDVPAPTTRVVARKQVNGRPRVSTGSLLQGVQRSSTCLIFFFFRFTSFCVSTTPSTTQIPLLAHVSDQKGRLP